MNQKCISTIEKIETPLIEVCDALAMLREGIEEENEDRINEAMEAFPTPSKLGSALEKLGMLIEHRPWESGRKKAHA
jgi:hypothetical protein